MRITTRRLGTVLLAVAIIGCGGEEVVNDPGDNGSTTTIGPTTTSQPTPSTTLLPSTTTTTIAAPDIEVDRLIQLLFHGDPPDHMVFQQQPDVIEVWDTGTLSPVDGWPGDIVDVERGLALVHTHNLDLVDLADGTVLRPDFDCVSLHSRDGVVLTLTGCGGPWDYQEAQSGDPVEPPVPYTEPGEVGGPFFHERGDGFVYGDYDAEGNFRDLRTTDGTAISGDDYGSLPTLSPDGALVAYVDHADRAAESHFVSPVVVLRDLATGTEMGRWVLDEPVTCLELSSDWLVACLGDPLDYPDGLQHHLTAIKLATGEVNTVATETRVFLPA